MAFGGYRYGAFTRKAMEISAAHEKEGLFKVTVWSWDDIVARALNFPDVAASGQRGGGSGSELPPASFYTRYNGY